MTKPAPMKFEHELIETIRQDLAAFETTYPDVPYTAMVNADYGTDEGGTLTSAKVVVTVIPSKKKAH